MSKQYLENIRGIFPIRSRPTKLLDYELIMNLKGPNFIEPSFANIRYKTGSKVEGILHEVSQNDLDRIVASEGETYELINEQVELDGSKVESFTLRSTEELSIEVPASRRYMDILIRAAVENGFSDEYIGMLKAKKSVYYPVLSEFYAIRLYLWVKKRAKLLL